MKIVTYNVNGLRSALSKGLTDWIAAERPDILCLQETKAQPEQIPTLELEALGIPLLLLLGRQKRVQRRGDPDPPGTRPRGGGHGYRKSDAEGRFLRADYGELSVVSVYHPSGTSGDERQAFKMQWLEDFQRYVSELVKERPQLILCGDYNICHRPIDIHDPVRNASSSGFLPEEREWMSRFLDSGFIDTFRLFDREPNQYTWWSFRANARANNKGWRIDYAMASEAARPLLKNAWLPPDVRHSDHCPAVLEITI